MSVPAHSLSGSHLLQHDTKHDTKHDTTVEQ